MVGENQRLGLVVRNVDERRAEIGLQLLQLDLHVLAELQIERAERLVEQQQRRLEDEAPRDRDALLLAARELVDALRLRAGKSDALQHRVDTARDLRARDTAPREAVADVVADRHHREQREVLEHHVDGPPVRRHAAHRGAADPHVTLVGREEPGDDPQQRGLPQPDGPRIEKKLPCATASDSVSTAACAP